MATRSVVATDNFNRADGALGANWSEAATAYTDNQPVIASNEAKSGGEGSYDNASYWSADSFANNQYSKATISVLPSSGTSLMGVIVRASASDFCFCQYKRDSGSNKSRLYWFNAGAYTAIAFQNTTTFASGDTIELEVEGTTYTMFKNGVSILSGANGSAPATGSAGITLYDLDERLDDWEGGDLIDAVHTPRMGFVNHSNPGIV